MQYWIKVSKLLELIFHSDLYREEIVGNILAKLAIVTIIKVEDMRILAEVY